MTDYTREQWAVLSEAERGPCVETSNSRNPKGYGRCGVRRFGKRINYTHVLAWVDAHGQLPPGDTPCVLHHCDNPPCVNDDHLWVGTNQENMDDREAKGRSRKGRVFVMECSRCGAAKEKIGREWRCRACRNQAQREHDYSREWATRNPEKARENQREWRARNPEKVREMERHAWQRRKAKAKEARALLPPRWTHCKYGHEFTLENTRRINGRRRCRICYNARSREARAKAKAASVGG